MEEWCYTASDITNERIFLKDIICDNKHGVIKNNF